MDKTTSEKIRLGIFVLLGTVLLVFGAYQIGNQENLFGNTFILKVSFKNVSGLKKGNNIRYSGISVGTVNGIEMENDTNIRVSMVIQENMLSHIKKNAIATIGTDGLVGSMIIDIVPGDGNAPFVKAEDEINSLDKIGSAEMLSTLSVTNENAARLTEGLLKTVMAINQGQGTLGRLLNDTLMANDLQYTLVNLRHASNGANSTIRQLNELVNRFNTNESVAGVLLGDSISGQKVRNAISHLETSTIEIESMSKELSSIVNDIRDGKGALNYLTTDTVLVGQLQNTMQNVDQGVERFNENMEALKHNFLTRGYFKKLEKQEKKEQGE